MSTVTLLRLASRFIVVVFLKGCYLLELLPIETWGLAPPLASELWDSFSRLNAGHDAVGLLRLGRSRPGTWACSSRNAGSLAAPPSQKEAPALLHEGPWRVLWTVPQPTCCRHQAYEQSQCWTCLMQAQRSQGPAPLLPFGPSQWRCQGPQDREELARRFCERNSAVVILCH